jgi:tetratricopeptide (TPR) repeat protein
MDKPLLTSTAHTLPFDKLDSSTFERLSLWLVKLRGYLRVEHYGLAGTEQGRDIIAYLQTEGNEELWYFQCKRYKEIDAGTLKKDVDKIRGLITVRPDLKPIGIVFIIRCAVSAKIRDEVKLYCSSFGMESEFWAHTELDMYVKEHPLIIQEFFNLPDKLIHTASVTRSEEMGVIPSETLERANDLFSLIPTDTVPSISNLPPGSRMVYRHNPLFVGRREDLIAIAKNIASGTSGQTVAITGLGGMGKTQLACEFVHLYGQYFAGGVFWINFENPESVPAEVAACGSTKYLNLCQNFEYLPLDSQVDLVLAAWDSPLPRLLIFDNCEDEVLLAGWKRVTGGCKTLITSRRTDWNPTLGVKVLHLDRLDRKESVLLLEQYSPDAYDDKTALSNIADNLGDLPLALHLAGSFLARYRNSISPSSYLSQLSRPDLLQHQSLQGRGQRRETSPTLHEQHVARTFALSYERLDAHEPVDVLAVKTLIRAAYLAQDIPIHQDILFALIDADHKDAESILQAEDALHRLLELGLLEREAEKTFRLHRLLAAFARETIPDNGAQAEVELTMLENTKFWNSVGQPFPLLLIQPHLRAVTDSATTREDENAAALCKALGEHLYLTGDYTTSRLYLEMALRFYEKLQGATGDLVGATLSSLGVTCRSTGDFNAAREYYERALKVAEPDYDQHKPELATLFNNMGLLLAEQGNYKDATDYYKKALAITEVMSESNDLLKAGIFNNLGLTLHEQGELDEALIYYEQALQIREEGLGEHHQRTAEVINNIGGIHSRRGDHDKAKQFYSRALELYRTVLNGNHPDIARTFINLAGVLKDEGDYGLARQYYEESLEIYRASSGDDQPTTILTIQMLAQTLLLQGETVAANLYLPQLRSLGTQTYKSFGNAYAKGMTELGDILLDQKKYDQAQPFFAKAIEVFDALEVKDELANAIPLMRLAMIYRHTGKDSSAVKLYKRALSLVEQKVEFYNPVIAMQLNYVADSLMRQGEQLEACSYYERAIEVYEHTETIDSDYTCALNNLATILREQGLISKAKKLYEKALALHEQTAGGQDEELIKVLNNLAVVYRREGEYKRARSLLERALIIANRISVTENELVALSTHNLACVSYYEGDFNSAVALSRRAISIYEKVFGPNHPSTYLPRMNLQKATEKLYKSPGEMKGRNRNALCPCGSGKKFKKCCG